MATQLDEWPRDLARQLLGEPNRALSSKKQLRFGRRGSVAVEIEGLIGANGTTTRTVSEAMVSL